MIVMTIYSYAMNNENDKKFDLDRSPGFVICMTALRFKGQMSRRLKSFDVTPEQWGVIAMLWDEDGITQKELSSRLYKDQPNTTRILDKLESKGLIKRVDNAEDRRAFLIYLTEEGRKMRDCLYPFVLNLRDDTWKGFSEEEMSLFMGMLDRIWANLE